MATLTATWTTAGLSLIMHRLCGSTGSLGLINSFKVGEGGWELTAAGKVPRAPDPTLTDLDCIVNPSRYPADSLANFQKSLSPGDMTLTEPGTVLAHCVLAMGEFNDDGFGNFPEIYEIGLYIGSTLAAYATFPVEIKSPSVQIPNDVTIVMEIG